LLKDVSPADDKARVQMGRIAGAAASLALIVSFVGPANASSASPPLRAPQLASIKTFAFAIGSSDLSGNLTQRYAGYSLLIIDGQEATRAQVAELHASGHLVLAYLDVGTIEPYRPWYRELKPYRLSYWRRWGEFYAAVNRPGYRLTIVDRIAPRILSKGFDGLFLDNTDMVESHPKERRGMIRLVAALARLVHRRHGLLFTQNGASVLKPILPYLDGWNMEEVSTFYNANRHRYGLLPRKTVQENQQTLRHVRQAGLLVLATGYTASASGEAARVAIANACAAGAIPFVSNIELTRIPTPPPSCG